MILILIILAALFLLGTMSLQAVSSAFRHLEAYRSKEQLKETDWLHAVRTFQRLFFPKRELEFLFFSISTTKNLLRLLMAASIALLLWLLFPGQWLWLLIGFIVLFAIALIVGDFLPRAWGTIAPERTLKIFSPIASPYLLLMTPKSYFLLLFAGKRFSSIYLDEVHEPVTQIKEKIIEMIQEADVQSAVDENEKQLLEAVTGLRDRIVREVMVPRIDVFALPIETTLREAARLLNEEGYSRAPVYEESIDKVVGLLMYKKIMAVYVEAEMKGDFATLETPVESFVQPIIFVPETSRVTHLLQEFRNKQTHLAVVVDEYGGTEGLVTIEDCIEEIVGEISDEYDEEEERLFAPHPSGGWIVDARMTILDIEEEFNLKIPQEGDYDTIGGYAFHCAGEIPAKGLHIYHDDFELEILESTERMVKKVRLTPVQNG